MQHTGVGTRDADFTINSSLKHHGYVTVKSLHSVSATINSSESSKLKGNAHVTVYIHSVVKCEINSAL